MKIDVIGDIHGCYDELCMLFEELGYNLEQGIYIHPKGRIPVFVGDLTDRGPDSLNVIQLVYEMVITHKKAKYVPGNHCNKLYRFFLGNKVQQKHGLETTVAEYESLDVKKKGHIQNQFMRLYEEAPLYLNLPEANAVIAHAGIKKSYIGRNDKKVKTFVLYGDITGKFDESGKPIRRDWAQHYDGDQWIVYGHTPILRPRIVNKTINIDTGCVFGNQLTAFRLPEEKTIAVPSSLPFQEEKFRSFPDD
ncbi:bis(5'-nucleosyl)-tetraphosphatase PrpE [Ornithinibacillus halotolerans]|uniref:Bis(5'-nucleosyl)-tetraphosphatase PrpE [asymmetrical] n=1 Tax=Ornithinibacillus halotolerans TaxID=1274357 RepID=A0A916RZL8_9BACI|nr:bis(5'-nucleosyl)-tetraphosphatase PrpE [Ornithinibacillus halotolerans]GGA74135.1 bis(5'-nucleosyl)-tetraphosphatase PrpE [asymmetrical] [Ornithinibacillus halotolerans]